MNTRTPWTPEDEAWLRSNYSEMNNSDIAILLDRTEGSISGKACEMGLKKSEAFMKSSRSGRIMPRPKTFWGRLWAWICLPFDNKKYAGTL